jgi:hypothetical protein
MRRHSPLVLSSLPALAALALLAAGCGGGGRSPGVASLASSTTAPASTTENGAASATQNGATSSPQSQLVAYSQCMRSNGVANFPDPQALGGGSFKLTIQRDAASNPRFQAASSACKHLLPAVGPVGSRQEETAQQQRIRLADELSFARCMRSHGYARFPDPTAQGDLSVEMVQAQGIDVHSPAVLQAVQLCLPAFHGLLTPAQVRQALNNVRR